MSLAFPHTARSGRGGELALWGAAGLMALAVHAGLAFYLMRETPEAPGDSSPPAAIMIELAAEPEAVNTEEEQIAPDAQDSREVVSEQTEPVEEPPEPIEQPQPEPEPMPEPVAEPLPEPAPEPIEPPPQEIAKAVEPEPAPPPVQEPPPEPEPPEPEPQVTETIPEPPPEPMEPIEEMEPVEEQMTAALENVEVPLPTMRPLAPPPMPEKPPEETKKPEPKKEPVKKVQRPKQQQQQRSQDMAQAKAQAKQSDRTAASQTSTGFFSPSVSPQRWMTSVRTKIARYARKCPGSGTGIVTVRFSFDGSGKIGSVSVVGSSGNGAIDDYVVSAVRRASPIPAPPSGAGSSLSQPVKCE